MNLPLIIFDLERVFVDSWHDVFLQGEFQVPPHVFHEFDASEIRKDLHRGKISEYEFLGHLKTALSIEADEEDLKRRIRDSLVVNADLLSRVQKLRKRHSVVLSSNYAREWAEHLIAHHNLDSFFDKMYFSFEHGIRKPDERAFRVILDEYGITPKDAVFIDDKERNVMAAQALGLNTVLFREHDIKMLEDGLKSFGIVL
ncbi:MAG: HAD-IA family hydrolase [Parcubacteria group bacterium]|nr:HAD-IA family hydrolase [Parcubacteria group bacterium]